MASAKPVTFACHRASVTARTAYRTLRMIERTVRLEGISILGPQRFRGILSWVHPRRQPVDGAGAGRRDESTLRQVLHCRVCRRRRRRLAGSAPTSFRLAKATARHGGGGKAG